MGADAGDHGWWDLLGEAQVPQGAALFERACAVDGGAERVRGDAQELVLGEVGDSVDMSDQWLEKPAVSFSVASEACGGLFKPAVGDTGLGRIQGMG